MIHGMGFLFRPFHTIFEARPHGWKSAIPGIEAGEQLLCLFGVLCGQVIRFFYIACEIDQPPFFLFSAACEFPIADPDGMLGAPAPEQRFVRIGLLLATEEWKQIHAIKLHAVKRWGLRCGEHCGRQIERAHRALVDPACWEPRGP